MILIYSGNLRPVKQRHMLNLSCNILPRMQIQNVIHLRKIQCSNGSMCNSELIRVMDEYIAANTPAIEMD